MENSLDNFFQIASRIIIFISIIIVLVALFLKFNQYKGFKQNITPTITVIPIPSSTGQAAIKLDLKGPFICGSREASISAYIKDKKVAAQNTLNNETTSYLLNGDCLYIWKKGSYQGQKTCGLSKYLPFVESFGVTAVLEKFSSFIPAVSDQEQIKNVMNLCKKEEITDVSIFETPKDVVFK